MSIRLWEIAKDPDRREALKWLLGGVAAILHIFVDHKDTHEKSVTNIYILDENAAKTLTVQLIRQTPAMPGTQGAVAGAVQSIARGAAEGDSRLQQAHDLLKENKIGEATQLLSSIAEEKTARAEQAANQAEQGATQAENDRKDAAIAYRNFGAIAALRDPKKALDAYAKAVELNPDDKESLYWHGWLSLLAGQLPVANIVWAGC